MSFFHESDDDGITLIIRHGTEGGAPPYRHFIGNVYQVKVLPSDSYAKMMQKIQKKVKLYSHNSTPALDKTKTVAENGLVDGSELRFWNGAVD